MVLLAVSGAENQCDRALTYFAAQGFKFSLMIL